MDLTKVDAIIENYDGDATSLLAIMQDVQDQENYLPREAVNHISAKLDVPVSRIYSMATFFESFHLEPRGKHICTVCMGTACHVRGAQRLVEHLERDLDVKSGGTGIFTGWLEGFGQWPEQVAGTGGAVQRGIFLPENTNGGT